MEKTLLNNNWIKLDSHNISGILKREEVFSFFINSRKSINYKLSPISPKDSGIMYVYKLQNMVYMIYSENIWKIEDIFDFRYDFGIETMISDKITKLNKKNINTESYLKYLLKKYNLVNKRDINIKRILRNYNLLSHP